MVGLGTMGRNFLLNVAEHGFSAIGYDLDEEKGSRKRWVSGFMAGFAVFFPTYSTFLARPGLWLEDAACQSGVSAIYDRTQEHLGTTDRDAAEGLSAENCGSSSLRISLRVRSMSISSASMQTVPGQLWRPCLK